MVEVGLLIMGVQQLEDIFSIVRTQRLEVACWPLVPKFAGLHQAEAVGIFRAKKSSAHLPSDGEVKPSVQCRSFTACKRSLNVTWNSAKLGKILGHFSPTVPPSAAGCSRVVTRVETPGGESWKV